MCLPTQVSVLFLSAITMFTICKYTKMNTRRKVAEATGPGLRLEFVDVRNKCVSPGDPANDNLLLSRVAMPFKFLMADHDMTLSYRGSVVCSWAK